VSNGTPDDGRLSKNERRDAAREKARLLREEQRKKDRRTRWILQGSIVLALLVVVAVVAGVLITSNGPSGPGPKNMASDGIQLSQGAIATETPALKAGEEPIPNTRDEEAGTIDIQLYVDYLCPYCGLFEATNSDYISSLLENGKTTVEVHPLAILDSRSQGTKYSTRAANAAACVANYSPNQFYDFHNLLFANQPEENTEGLSDDQLVDLTTQAAVENPDQIVSCIKDLKFKKWVADARSRALNGPIPDSDVDKVKGTPTIIVNGNKYEGSLSDLASFQAFVIQAAGSDFNENSTPTPEPSSTPTPAS
jgi:protein-disulfide isomerase